MGALSSRQIQTEDILQSLTQGRPRCITDATIDCRLPTLSHNGDRVQTLCKLKRLVRKLTAVNDAKAGWPYNSTNSSTVSCASWARSTTSRRRLGPCRTPTRCGFTAPSVNVRPFKADADAAVECDLTPELRVGYAGDGPAYAAWQRLYLRLLIHVS